MVAFAAEGDAKADEKQVIVDRRREAVARAEERALQVRTAYTSSIDADIEPQKEKAKAKAKYDRDQYLVKQQMEVERKERERIAALKQQERHDAEVCFVLRSTYDLTSPKELATSMGR